MILDTVVHPDGTIFAIQENWTDANHDAGLPNTIVGIDPTAGAVKFSVPVPVDRMETEYPSIIAGDGYAYLPYVYITNPETGWPFVRRLAVLRVNSSGAHDNIDVFSWTGGTGEIFSVGASVITNADQGTLLTWSTQDGPGMATTTGASASIVSAPPVPGGGQVVPVLQAQDGSFVGTAGGNMVAFNATGTVRWIVPNETPQIATADGGAQSPETALSYGDCHGG